MAIWPFNRKRKTTTANTSVPPEVQDYYNAQHRERVGVAWLIATASLLVCIVVVMGLFFGGRWVYRQIAHKDQPETAAVEENTSDTKNESEQDQSADDKNKDNSSQNKDQQSTLPGDGSSTSNTTPQTSSTSTTTPESAGKMTNTGPGDTVAIFAISTVAGVVLYQAALRRKASS